MRNNKQNQIKFVNKTFTNKYEQNYTVIEYFNNTNITVKFEDETIVKNITTVQIKDGRVLNRNSFKRLNSLNPTYTNIGYMGIGKYNNVNSHEYVQIWQSMLQRCYDEKRSLKYPTYLDCSVDEKWHNYQNFAEWCSKEYVEGFCLDKDIIIKGNKIYSEETCCFVPSEINQIFPNCKRTRGLYPIGVSILPKGKNRPQKYLSRTSNCNKYVTLGSFDSPEEAFIAYKTYKERYIKWMSLVWKAKISEKVFLALQNYKIEITD